MTDALRAAQQVLGVRPALRVVDYSDAELDDIAAAYAECPHVVRICVLAQHLRAENARLHALIAAGHTHEWRPIDLHDSSAVWGVCVSCEASFRWPAPDPTDDPAYFDVPRDTGKRR